MTFCALNDTKLFTFLALGALAVLGGASAASAGLRVREPANVKYVKSIF